MADCLALIGPYIPLILHAYKQSRPAVELHTIFFNLGEQSAQTDWQTHTRFDYTYVCIPYLYTLYFCFVHASSCAHIDQVSLSWISPLRFFLVSKVQQLLVSLSSKSASPPLLLLFREVFGTFSSGRRAPGWGRRRRQRRGRRPVDKVFFRAKKRVKDGGGCWMDFFIQKTIPYQYEGGGEGVEGGVIDDAVNRTRKKAASIMLFWEFTCLQQ